MGALGRDRTGLSALLSGALVGVLISIAPGQIRIVGGGVAVGGSTTYVQFNDAGALGGDAGLTYNKTTDTLSVEDQLSLTVSGFGATGTITATAIGTALIVSTADHTEAGETAGPLQLFAGSNNASGGNGGNVDLQSGTTNDGAAGTLTLSGGSSGSGSAGNVIIAAGSTSAGGTDGTVTITAPTGGPSWVYSRVANRAQLAFPPTTFANLGTPDNGAFVYCSDCTIANPCAGSSTGAFAKRLNGVWVCN